MCQRENPRSVDSKTTPDWSGQEDRMITRRSAQDITMTTRIPHPMDIIDSGESCSKRYVMKYYVQILANLLTTTLENNYFVTIFIPMSIESDSVLSALMAWSSMHLSRFDRSFTIPSLEYKSTALNAIASELTPTTIDTIDSTLAATLILCSLEVGYGDTSRWYDHLIGAKFIIENARSLGPNGKVFTGTDHFMRTLDGQWLLSHFAYHDIIGSVTLDQPPLLRGAYWLKGDPVIDPYLGVGSEVLVFVSEISCLELSSEGVETDFKGADSTFWLRVLDPSQYNFVQQALRIERELQEWNPPATVDQTLQDLAKAYRSSALIHLYRKVRSVIPASTDLANSKIADCVEETITHIKAIAPKSLPECSIPFPMFMAGCETVDPEQTRYISEKLEFLLTSRGFGNIKTMLDILHELWRLKLAGQKGPRGGPVDWSDIADAKGWKVPVM